MLYLLTGEGNDTPLQYSCLENPMDGGAWWAAVHGVAMSQARLSNLTFSFHFPALGKEIQKTGHVCIAGSLCYTVETIYGEGDGTPLQYSCLGKSHGWRSLIGCSPWGH